MRAVHGPFHARVGCLIPRRIRVLTKIGVVVGVMIPSVVWAGQPLPWQMGFQLSASPVMDRIIAFNNFLLIVIVCIAGFVLGLLGFVIWRFSASRNPIPGTWSHNTPLEILWTLVPALILIAIAVPSFRLLYYQDRIPPADLTIKVEGHQWYWSYTYPDLDIAFDSIMVEEGQLLAGQPRLLTADTPMTVPVGRVVRVQLTADDVLHSWAVPSLGVRIDTVPGRLNETWFQVREVGLYHGYCAELCGIRHAYMPVVVKAVTQEQFNAWVVHEMARRHGGRKIDENNTETSEFVPHVKQPLVHVIENFRIPISKSWDTKAKDLKEDKSGRL